MRRRERPGLAHRVDVGVDHARQRSEDLERAAVEDLDGLEARGASALGRHPRLARAAGLAGAVARHQGSQQLALAASGAAFWLLISSFPIATAVVSLYGLVVDPSRVASDLGNLVNAAPGSLGALIGAQLRHVAATDHAGLSVGLAVSIALAVWSASAGIYHLDCAIREAYGVGRQRYVDARARSLVAACVLVVALGAVALSTGAALAHAHGVVAFVVGVPLLFVGTAAAVTALYRFSVGHPMRRREFLPGAIAAAAGTMVLLVGFSAYASVSTHYTAVYGGFSAAVVGMIAAYLAVYASLLGAVLNVQLTSSRHGTHD
jgi:membrane protein